MRASTTEFTLGLIAGALVVWIWGDQISRYLDERTRGIRSQAADGLETVQGMAEGALDTARDRIHSTLQAGQGRVRPRLERLGS